MKRIVFAACVTLSCKGEPKGEPKAAPSAAPTVATVATSVASAAPSASVSVAPQVPAGPRFLARHIPQKAAASSEYRGKGEWRKALYAFDGTRSTAWNRADSPKGSDADKAVQWLEAQFEKPKSIRVLRIDTGYDDWSAKYGDLWLHNAHAKKLSISLDGAAPITRAVAENERVATVRLPDGTKAKTVRVSFDELWPGDKWQDIAVTEIGLFGDPDGFVEEQKVLDSVKGIEDHYEEDSASRGAQLAMSLGMPIPADLVTEQRARVNHAWADLDGRGKDYLFVSMVFRTRPNAERARRQIVMTAILGRTSPASLSLLAHDTVIAQPDTFGFDADTRAFIPPRTASDERDELWVRWKHTSLDPSGQRVAETGLRLWACAQGFAEPVFEQIFHRAEKTAGQGDFEAVTMQSREDKSVQIDIDGKPVASFQWDASSGIYAPN